MRRFVAPLSSLFLLFVSVFANLQAQDQPRSLEISEDDGLPVLVKHLPEWESVRTNTIFIRDASGLKKALPGRPILDGIDFTGGTEAVVATYPAGKMLIVEFPGPQASSETDAKLLSTLAATPDPSIVYRRIGNYNVFVFDAADPAQAIGLLDQVSYEKNVQWLGEDPFLLKKLERYFVATTRDIFISTVLWIVGGIGISVVLGLICGIIFFRIREQQRSRWSAYSDSGGLTRLNLDDLSE